MSCQLQMNEVMTSSLPLLIPLLLFSFLSGVLAEFSHWFGSFFVIVSVAVYATTYRIGTVKKVVVKPLEVTLLGILVPIFAIASALSSFLFPQAKMTLSFALITLLIPHFALLWRMRFEMNQISTVITSSIQMGFGLVGTGFTYKKGWVAVVLNIAILTYAVVVKCGAIAALRERMPLRKTRVGWLIVSVIFTCIAIASYMFLPISVFLISTAIAVTSAIIFGFIDYLIHLMRTPEAEWWTFNSLPNLHLAIKLLSVLIIVCYGVMGVIARPENLQDVIGEDFWCSMMLDLVVLLFAHAFLSAAVCKLRQKEHHQTSCQPMNKIAVLGISGIIALITVMVSVACYYCNASHPSVVHESFMLVSVAVLYILLIYLLDMNRSFLARFYGKLLATVTGIAIYIALCGYYWRSIVGFVTRIIPNPVPGNDGNSTIVSEEANLIEPGIIDLKEEIEPIKRTVFVAELLCAALVIHLVFCLIFERSKKQRLMRQLASTTDCPAPAPTAPLPDIDCENDLDETKKKLLPVV